MAHDCSFVPSSLNAGERSPVNMGELTPLVKFIYHFTEAIYNADRTRFTLKLSFFNATREQFLEQVDDAEIIEAFAPQPNIGSIHKCIRHVVSPGFRLTRENNDAMAAELGDGDLNTCIRTYAAQINNTVNNDTQMFVCFTTVLEHLSRSVAFLLTKTILAIGLYKEVYAWTSQIPALEAAVTDMLLSLGSRTETNEEALRLVNMRNQSGTKYTNYKNMTAQNHWDTLRNHLRGFEVNFVNFRWTEFTVRIADRTIWWTHAVPSDTQLSTLLEDPDLATISKRLDGIVEKIRGYQPSRDVANISKKNRVIQRVALLKDELQAFKDGTGKNVSRARLMIDSLKFLNKQLETLHLEDGIEYTAASTGFDPSDVAAGLEELEEYVLEQDNIKKQKELSQKLNSMEFSRHMPGVSIVKLQGPENYLSWLNWYNSMSKMVSNSITKVTLVKQSLTNKTDQRFLENVSNLKEIIEFIKNKYSSKDEILFTELNKLYRMKRCGTNMKLMSQNSEKFLCTVALLDLHGLGSKVDRTCRSRIIDKVLTVSQQQQYLYDLVKAETIWKAKYEVRKQTAEGEDEEVQEVTLEPSESKNVSFQARAGAGSSSTPFNTPLASPTASSHSNPMVELVPLKGTTDNKLTTEQFENVMEKLKRAHFLRHHKRYFETVRRILHLSSTFYHEKGDNRYNTNFRFGGSYRHYNYDYNYKTEPVGGKNLCPLCKKSHKPALVWCYAFKDQSVEERHKTIAAMFKGCCQTCLAFDGKDNNHKGGVCSIQLAKRLKCKICSSTKHHSLLCKNSNKTPSNNPKGGFSSNSPRGGFSGRGGGQGRGRGRGRGRGGGGPGDRPGRQGKGGRGGQFKRETRKQRISNSEKAYHIVMDDDECTCEGYEEDAQHHSHAVMVDTSQPVRVEIQKAKTLPTTGQTCKVHEKMKNVCQKHKKKAEHIAKGHPDDREFYMALTTLCDAQGPNSKPEKAIVLWDTASSLSFVTKELCRRAKFPEVGKWQGTISTIESQRKSRYSIHMVTLRDHRGKLYETPCLAIDHIGTKDKIPDHIFSYIARSAKISQENLEKIHGKVDILLGVASLMKFPVTVECPGQEDLGKKLPNIKIVQCSISAQLIPFGYYSVHKLPWSKARSENFGIFSRENSIGQKNHMKLRLRIPRGEDKKGEEPNAPRPAEATAPQRAPSPLMEEDAPGTPPTPPPRVSPLTQLSRLAFPKAEVTPASSIFGKAPGVLVEPEVNHASSIFSRAPSVRVERGFHEAAKFWQKQAEKPKPSEEQILQTINDHYCAMSRKAKQEVYKMAARDVDEVNCERMRPISMCFRTQRRLKSLLDKFTFHDFNVDHEQCTITLRCDDGCLTHRHIRRIHKILQDTVPPGYNPQESDYMDMSGQNFMVGPGPRSGSSTQK